MHFFSFDECIVEKFWYLFTSEIVFDACQIRDYSQRVMINQMIRIEFKVLNKLLGKSNKSPQMYDDAKKKRGNHDTEVNIARKWKKYNVDSLLTVLLYSQACHDRLTQWFLLFFFNSIS